MKTVLRNIVAGIAIAVSVAAAASVPAYWLENDSAAAIDARISRDFPYTVDQFYKMVKAERPDYTRAMLDADIKAKRVETMDVNGTTMVFRKALRNMKLLADPDWKGRGSQASEARISYVDSVLDFYRGTNPLGVAHRVKYRFSIDVPVVEEIAHDTLRVWMPVPIATQRQSDIRILSAEPSAYILSGDRSVHNSIFFEQPTGAAGDTIHFEYVAEFVTRGEHFEPREILASIRPYDTESPLYIKYTSFEAPHIVRLDSLAKAIVGAERNPFKRSELVFDYIASNYPWAGAREYSTIPCIPAYVVEQGHGDCGQVALLYISLMRSLGIPARWESGWMLHPGEKNLHDWAEVYFEGVGWVPVDLSFGRYSGAKTTETKNFYSHGIDSHRMATNLGVCGEFFPPKRFVRSETVDAQMGEVETTRGNLFYPAWDQHLQLLSVEPVEVRAAVIAPADLQRLKIKSTDRMAWVRIPVATIRENPAHSAEIGTQAVMGQPVRILDEKGGWLMVETAEGYTGWVPDSSVVEASPDAFGRWLRSADRRVVASLWQDRVYASPAGAGPRDIVSDIVLGSILEVDPTADLSYNPLGRVPVVLPDGRRGWTAARLEPIAQWADQEFDADKILDTAYSMEGTPYLWGGTSTKAIDCSGLVKVSYLNNGLILLRNASQQARTGQQLDPNSWTTYEPGDLLFFGNSKTGKVTHVGIYDHDGKYVHSSGRVKRNSLDPASDAYLYSPLSAVRINGKIGTDGIIPASAHPWYFVQ